jgi:hypothetical protein
MGLERDYQIEIPSKQFKNYSVLITEKITTLNFNFMTDLTDAEGSFTVTIYPEKIKQALCERVWRKLKLLNVV